MFNKRIEIYFNYDKIIKNKENDFTIKIIKTKDLLTILKNLKVFFISFILKLA